VLGREIVGWVIKVVGMGLRDVELEMKIAKPETEVAG